MYNVLHILTGDDGGITTVVKNYYKYIDKQEIHFDIACTTEIEGNDISVLKSMGAEIYHLPMKSREFKKYIQELKKLLNANQYDAVHVHENETSYIALEVAKRCGIKNRIAHSHTSSPSNSFVAEIRRCTGIVLNYYYATCLIGCGQLAGERVFGKRNMKSKKAMVLPNAIDSERFTYNERVRNDVRRELDVSNQFLIGFVGRLSPEKNHFYALNIIEKLHKILPNACLVIVGDGDEEVAINNYIREHHMSCYVRLLGKRRDVERLYQAFDALILPSIHEAFPLVVVEAMSSGLPVLLSSNITNEFSFGESVRYVELGKDDKWIETLKQFSEDRNRLKRLEEVKANGLDIKQTITILENIYLKSK